MSLVPDGGGGSDLVEWLFDLGIWLIYQYYFVSEWLEVAPIIYKAKLRQLGRNGIDRIPFISDEMKWKIKRWLREYFGL